MNSVQALDYALRIVQGHRVSSAAALAFKEDAVTTLEALRNMISDQEETRARERAIIDDWVERAGRAAHGEREVFPVSYSGGRMWLATCTCRWSSQRRPTEDRARAELADHVALLNHTPNHTPNPNPVQP